MRCLLGVETGGRSFSRPESESLRFMVGRLEAEWDGVEGKGINNTIRSGECVPGTRRKGMLGLVGVSQPCRGVQLYSAVTMMLRLIDSSSVLFDCDDLWFRREGSRALKVV